MKKVIILLGPDKSGKTHTARQIQGMLRPDTVVSLSAAEFSRKGRSNNFSVVSNQTMLVIIDEIRDVKIIRESIVELENRLVERQSQRPVIINPMLICICDSAIEKEDFKKYGLPFSERVNVLECVNLDIQ